MFTFYFLKFGSPSFVFDNKPSSAPGGGNADTGPEAEPSGAPTAGPKPPEPPHDREEELRRQTQAREAAAGEARQGTLDANANLLLADAFKDERSKQRFSESIAQLGEGIKKKFGAWIEKYKDNLKGINGAFSADDIIQEAEKVANIKMKQESKLQYPFVDTLIQAGKLPAQLPVQARQELEAIAKEYMDMAVGIYNQIQEEETLIGKLGDSEKQLFEKYRGAISIEGGKMAIDEMQIPEAERVQIKPQLEALKAKYESLAKAGEQGESGNEEKIAALVAAIMKFFEWLSQKLTETFGSIEKAVAKGKKDAKKGGEPRTAQTGSPSEGGKPPENPAEQTVAFLREAIPGLTPDELAALSKFPAQKLAKGQVKKPDNFDKERFEKAIGLLKSNKAEGLTDGDLAVAAFFEGKFQKNEPPSGLAETDEQPQDAYPDFEAVRRQLKTPVSGLKISINPGNTLTTSPDKNKAVLTLDICSAYTGATLQSVLQSLALIEQKKDFPVVLFVTGSALKSTEIRAALERLKTLPHVAIEAHGLEHRPCTSQAADASLPKYFHDQKPTGSLEAAYKEIVEGARAIQALTGKKPKYFRSATRYSDPLVEEMVRVLGMEMVSQSRGTDDNGASDRTGGQIRKGAIYLGHAKNFDGVKNLYARLEQENIPTAALS